MVRPEQVAFPRLRIQETLIDSALKENEWDFERSVEIRVNPCDILLDRYREVGWVVERSPEDTAIITFTLPPDIDED